MTTTTIKIADEDVFDKSGTSSGLDVGGVYNSRSLSRSPYPHDRRSLSRVSSARAGSFGGDPEDGEDWRRDDSKKKQVFKGTTLLW